MAKNKTTTPKKNSSDEEIEFISSDEEVLVKKKKNSSKKSKSSDISSKSSEASKSSETSKSSEISKSSEKKKGKSKSSSSKSESKSKSSKSESKGSVSKSSDEEEIVPKKRNKVTIQSLSSDFDTILHTLDSKIDEYQRNGRSGIKLLRTTRKSIRRLKRQSLNIASFRRSKPRNPDAKPSGFMLESNISKELRDFLKLKKGEHISRVEATRAICVYVNLEDDEKRPDFLKWKHLNPNGRNLQDPDERKSVIPDEKLSKLLNYDQYRKDVKKGLVYIQRKDKETKIKTKEKVTSDKLYYYTIQRLLSQHIKTSKT